MQTCIKTEKYRCCKIRITGRVFENTDYLFFLAHDIPATLWTDSGDYLINPNAAYKCKTRQID